MEQSMAGRHGVPLLKADPTDWLLEKGAPWVVYNTLKDLLGRPEDDPEVVDARRDVLEHPKVQGLLEQVGEVDWTNPPWTYLKSAKMPVHTLGVLGDFGVKAEDDPRLERAARDILSLQHEKGGLRYVPYLRQPLTCLSAPLLYALVKLGLKDDPRVHRVVRWYLEIQRPDGGWDCHDPRDTGPLYEPSYTPKSRMLEYIVRRPLSCPQTTLDILRSLVEYPDLRESEAVLRGMAYLLDHWRRRDEPYRPIGFGIGRDFRKLKYPFHWYHILKFADVLSRIPAVWSEEAFWEVIDVIVSKQDEQGRFKPDSIYKAWRDFDFGQKKEPSPWITFIVVRILKRAR